MNHSDMDLQKEWRKLMDKLEPTFGSDLDLEAVIFLIGIQELGQGYRSFKKQEKVDLMHIAICRLMSNYGYYEYEGMDKDGWPHWKTLSKMPHLNAKAQSTLMKESILEYFNTADQLN